MSVNEKMKRIADNIRYRTGKPGVLGLDDIANEILDINWVADPFFAKAERASGVDEMTDKNKIYFNVDTDTIWVYRDGAGGGGEVTEQIVGTEDNPWGAGRLSSGVPNGAAGYVTTPYIDLTKYSVPFELHLEGIPFLYTNNGNIRFSTYGTDKAHITTQLSNSSAINTYTDNIVMMADTTNNTFVLSCTPPVKASTGAAIGYMRFSGQGTEANANVYITYQDTSSSESGWVDTGIKYIDGQCIAIDEDIELPIPPVKAFMDSADYDSNDYSYTQVTNYVASGDPRRDLPTPFVQAWTNIENAILYAVSINSVTYYITENSVSLSNFIPNTVHGYNIYALREDGRMVAVKIGSFTTTADKTRMLNIEGIQNVRDVGGYTALNGKKVKYSLIYRGSAMDETESTGLITEAGKYEMVTRLGIKTDIDLRYGKTESALGADVDFIKTSSGYDQYDVAITNSTQRKNFKMLLESIVTQLAARKPIYIHCSGGCDRTGTLVFLLLGLLGVSESDLAKEYELSSFSKIGRGRCRNSDTYEYKEMVAALKSYSGATITDKFYDFATTGCGVAADTIARFRSLMLA